MFAMDGVVGHMCCIWRSVPCASLATLSQCLKIFIVHSSRLFYGCYLSLFAASFNETSCKIYISDYFSRCFLSLASSIVKHGSLLPLITVHYLIK